MKKILLISFMAIILSACTTNQTPAKKSIYKDALDKAHAIKENVDQKNQEDSQTLK